MSLLAAVNNTIANANATASSGFFSSSSQEEGDNKKAWFGFIGCLFCVIGYGSSYIPVKRYVTGDGFFYQMFLALGVWFVGLWVNVVQGFPKVNGIVLLGGAIWSIGNFLAVYTVQLIGFALGIPLYNVWLLIVGWSTGTFGLGIKKNKVSVPALNYVGVVVAIIAVILYIFVNGDDGSSDDDKKKKKGSDKEKRAGSPGEYDDNPNRSTSPAPLKGNYERSEDGIEIVDLPRSPRTTPSLDENGGEEEKLESIKEKEERELRAAEEAMHSGLSDFIQGLGPRSKRVAGIILSIITGVCFSVNFIPAQHLIDYDDDASKDQLDYIFTHFSGFLLMTLVAFLGYCLCMKNRPIVYPRLAFPAFISGVLVGLAQVGWYIGNKNLSFNITFPINTSGPSVVASLWGILVFKEIRGFKQLTLVTIAIVVSVVGVILITLSKFL